MRSRRFSSFGRKLILFVNVWQHCIHEPVVLEAWITHKAGVIGLGLRLGFVLFSAFALQTFEFLPSLFIAATQRAAISLDQAQCFGVLRQLSEGESFGGSDICILAEALQFPLDGLGY